MWFLMLASLFTSALAAPPTVPDRAPDEVKEGDLAKGTQIDTKWAQRSDVTCFVAPDAKYFNGNVEFHRFPQKANEDIYIRVTPAEGVDINMYVLQLPSSAAGATPPNVGEVFRCHRAWSKYAGEEETLHVEGYKANYEVVIGVASVTGTTAGTYKLEYWHQPGRQW